MKLLAIDVGGTEIKSAVVDEQYNLSQWNSIPTPTDNIEHFIETMNTIYQPYKGQVEGVAVALPGFIDTENGLCNSGGALVYNSGQYVGKMLSEKFGCPVRLENDGKAAAMAELANGVLKGCQNAAVFIIGTGVGGGIIIDGKLVKGKNFTAGELSFVTVAMDSDDEDFWTSSMCGFCTTPTLLKLYAAKANSEEEINGREFFRRYFENDPAAIAALDQFARYVAIQCMNLGVILNCEKVAIGGGISRQPILIEKIREKMDTLAVNKLIEYNKTENYMKPEIVGCHYSSDANLIGAVYSYKQQLGL